MEAQANRNDRGEINAGFDVENHFLLLSFDVLFYCFLNVYEPFCCREAALSNDSCFRFKL